MTSAFLAIGVAYLLTWVPRGVARLRAGSGDAPEWLVRLKGTQGDADRLFPAFAAGVIVAHLAGLDPHRLTVLAVAHVVTRAVHPWLHAGKIDYLATAVWAVGLAAVAALYLLPVLAG